jgi:ferrous iron transport protein B
MTKDKTHGAPRTVLLVGNPNVGKSVIFSILTGQYVTVSNYPGTTVEVMRGGREAAGVSYEIVDTPGTNNFLPSSEDEQVTRDMILEAAPHLVVQVADAKNLKRALFLSVQMAEMGVPFALVLNMMDEAVSRGVTIDVDHLRCALGVNVVPMVAVERKGVEDLLRVLCAPKKSPFAFQYHPHIEEALDALKPLLPEAPVSARTLGVMLLAGDETLRAWLAGKTTAENLQTIERIRQDLQLRYRDPLSFIINTRRRDAVEEVLEQSCRIEEPLARDPVTALGHAMLHPLWGSLIALIVLYAFWLIVGKIGAGVLVDLLEKRLFNGLITPWLQGLLGHVPWPFLQDLLTGEYGLFTMALTYSLGIILPIVTAFFFAFGILEDSGYLPRLAVMMNRIFSLMGLHGKAVLPMILGLGCGTMATLATRILESRKERLVVTLLLALGVPCSAQLGVILGMLGKLPPLVTVMWLAIVLGVVFLVGALAARLLPGECSDFLLEIPPLRLPKISNLAKKTMARIEWYLKEAVPLFFLGTLVLFVLARTGILQWAQSASAPVMSTILGLPPQVTATFLIGFLRRDYGAAGLYVLFEKGLLDPGQVLVSLVTITLFIPCIAQFFVTIKERGIGTALAIAAFVFAFAFAAGGLLNRLLHSLNVTF